MELCPPPKGDAASGGFLQHAQTLLQEMALVSERLEGLLGEQGNPTAASRRTTNTAHIQSNHALTESNASPIPLAPATSAAPAPAATKSQPPPPPPPLPPPLVPALAASRGAKSSSPAVTPRKANNGAASASPTITPRKAGSKASGLEQAFALVASIPSAAAGVAPTPQPPPSPGPAATMATGDGDGGVGRMESLGANGSGAGADDDDVSTADNSGGSSVRLSRMGSGPSLPPRPPMSSAPSAGLQHLMDRLGTGAMLVRERETEGRNAADAVAAAATA
ncbi:hypothetical protein Agub_g15751, partial [Astrephomene gubernaculifera]